MIRANNTETQCFFVIMVAMVFREQHECETLLHNADVLTKVT